MGALLAPEVAADYADKAVAVWLERVPKARFELEQHASDPAPSLTERDAAALQGATGI